MPAARWRNLIARRTWIAALAIIYVVVSVALGLAWIATEFRLLPGRVLAVEFFVAAVVWPFLLVFVVVLLLATKSKKHDE